MRHPLLNEAVAHAVLRQAWHDSQPGVTGGHEEGGFVLRDSTGNLSVVRWPAGGPNEIDLPSHPGCCLGEREIVATFHTHPNTGDEYLQEPSETDRRAVRDDVNLKGPRYVGEFVVSQETIYLIAPDGQVSQVGPARQVLTQG